MTSFFVSNWEIIAALLAAIWAIIIYFLTRQRELSWKR